MEDSEKNRYIEFLLQQKEERDRTIADKDAFIKNLQDTLDMLKSMHESDSKKISQLLYLMVFKDKIRWQKKQY